MPRPTKAQKIEALQIARDTLKKKPLYYFSGICTSLPSTAAGDEMRRYITKQLGSYAFLSGWLHANKPELIGDANSLITVKNLREYRLQWIDWMIACLEGKNP